MATINNGESGSSVRTKLNDIINKVEGVTSINNDIDVTGTVTADGLTVEDADGATIRIQSSDTSVDGGSLGQLEFYSNDASTGSTGVKGKIQVSDNGSSGQNYEMNFFTGYVTGGAHAETKKMSIGPYGDISFYEDTGTTAKFFWDASAESLNIRTTSSGSAFELNGNGRVLAGNFLQFNRTDNATGAKISNGGAGNGLIFNELNSEGFKFQNNGSDKVVIDNSGNVGIGTSSPAFSSGSGLRIERDTTATLRLQDTVSHGFEIRATTSAAEFYSANSKPFTFETGGSERMRLDASGSLLVGKTSASSSTAGFQTSQDGQTAINRSGTALQVGRLSSDGDIVEFRKDGTTVGSIGTKARTSQGRIFVGNSNTRLLFDNGVDAIIPANNDGNDRDNAIDLGASGARFDDIYATNAIIQTSDRNEKQDIAELDEAERRVAVAAKGLLRKFRWRDAVAEKGDDARIHFGIIAQDLQAAFEAEGLDAGKYAMFIHSTWTDEETGEERSRMGVRYSELLAFIIAAI